jgi:pyruvate/2-oxoglutarate dehydrogenase complex dihydrolipoamide acyltransferase (E2) component
MTTLKEIRVPDIGDFSDVEIIEVLVHPGETVNKEDSLITVESDKASMEIPSTENGVVEELKVGVGDRVSEGDVILSMRHAEATQSGPDSDSQRAAAAASTAPTSSSSSSDAQRVV